MLRLYVQFKFGKTTWQQHNQEEREERTEESVVPAAASVSQSVSQSVSLLAPEERER